MRCRRFVTLLALWSPGLACDPAHAAPSDAGCTDCGEVLTRLCVPGASSCGDDGLSPRVCDADGMRWVAGAVCHEDSGEVCDRGACVRACEMTEGRRETRGCEFWPVQTLHPELGRFVDGASREDFPFTIVVSNPWPSRVTITLSGGALGAPITRAVAAGATESLEVPWQQALVDGVDHLRRASALVRGGALHLTATAPVTAYQFNPLKFIRSAECESGDACYSFSGDASLLLPAAALGREHVVVAMPTQRTLPPGRTEWTSAAGFLSVVGTRENTEVTVLLRSRLTAGDGIAAMNPGESARFTLGAGDVLQLLSPTDVRCARDELDRVTDTRFCLPVDAEDLTGTVVTATAPVAVFAGHECALVPFNRYACDHLEEQIPPAETLGTRYVIARAAPVPQHLAMHPEGEPTLVRVVATHDDTDVTFEPASTRPAARLARGESLTIESRDDYAVVGSQPLLVASFLVGGDYFRAEVASSLSGRGDPSLSIETPVEQYRPSYDFFVPPAFVPSYANVVISRGERVQLDGRAVATPPSTTLGARDIYRIEVSAGAHHLEGVNPMSRFGLRVYGYALFTSFMYPGGGDLVSIAPPL